MLSIGFIKAFSKPFSTTFSQALSTALSQALSTALSTTFSTLREDVVAQDHDIIQMPIISVQFILGHTVQFQTFLYFLQSRSRSSFGHIPRIEII